MIILGGIHVGAELGGCCPECFLEFLIYHNAYPDNRTKSRETSRVDVLKPTLARLADYSLKWNGRVVKKEL